MNSKCSLLSYKDQDPNYQKKKDQEPDYKAQVVSMAGLFDKQAEIYLDARPTYPTEWFSKLAALTSQHSLAWDVGTGNGQAALGVSLPLSNIAWSNNYFWLICGFC
jgi:hypothetical protein